PVSQSQGQSVGIVVPLLVVAKNHLGEIKGILLHNASLDSCVSATTTHPSQNGRACGTKETCAYLAFCIEATLGLRLHVQTGSRLFGFCKAGNLLCTPANT
ncbi:unnamed protein product, partial [Ectocarpus sp. 12 AP-2014]